MARKLSCMRAKDVQRPARERAQGSRSTSRHTPALDIPEGSRSRRRTAGDDEDDSDDERADPSFGHEVLGGFPNFTMLHMTLKLRYLIKFAIISSFSPHSTF